MKKVYTFILFIVLLISFTSCAVKNDTIVEAEHEQIEITNSDGDEINETTDNENEINQTTNKEEKLADCYIYGIEYTSCDNFINKEYKYYFTPILPKDTLLIFDEIFIDDQPLTIKLTDEPVHTLFIKEIVNGYDNTCYLMQNIGNIADRSQPRFITADDFFNILNSPVERIHSLWGFGFNIEYGDGTYAHKNLSSDTDTLDIVKKIKTDLGIYNLKLGTYFIKYYETFPYVYESIIDFELDNKEVITQHKVYPRQQGYHPYSPLVIYDPFPLFNWDDIRVISYSKKSFNTPNVDLHIYTKHKIKITYQQEGALNDNL